MKIESIDVTKTLDKAKKRLAKEKTISPPFKVVIEVLLLIITLMVERLTKNSSNSSKPPSSDPNRADKNKNKNKSKETQKKPGGQNGHVGCNLSMVENPDEIVDLKIKPKSLPSGKTF
jgi:transposase